MKLVKVTCMRAGVLADTLCGALGTRLIALLREWQGDYLSGIAGLMAMTLIAGFVVLTLGDNRAREL